MFKNSIFSVVVSGVLFTSCLKEKLEIKDVNFTSSKTTVAVNEEVTFTFTDGADALSIYTGDARKDFEKSRINLVEQKGYTEEQLKTNVYALRIPDLKEYLLYIPKVNEVPAGYTFTGPPMEIYNGKLVPWDYSNATNSRYINMKIPNGNPYTLTIKPGNAVLPQMLNYVNTNLTSLGALNTTPNNTFSPYCSFPDGFTSTSTTGIGIKFGVQVVIDGAASPISYTTITVRELLDNLAFNLQTVLTAWRTTNIPLGKDPKKGIDEVRLIFNADDPIATDDDGDLLSYTGNVYMQEVRLGDAANVIQSFNEGVKIPFVYSNNTQTYKYKYSVPGVYKAVMVATYVGRKKYSGNGYITGRPDEILASEYDLERRFKTIEITVK
ncbi:MAG: hypothetical protein RLZZ424_12 [Bacteroidota bacterium]|jgi:hypothetical protein